MKERNNNLARGFRSALSVDDEPSQVVNGATPSRQLHVQTSMPSGAQALNVLTSPGSVKLVECVWDGAMVRSHGGGTAELRVLWG